MAGGCACGAGCAAGVCAAAAGCSCAAGMAFVPVMASGAHGGSVGFTPEESEREQALLSAHNDHVEDHVKELSKRHFSYKGWTITPYVSYVRGFAQMKWKANNKNDRAFKGENYGEVKLSILRYVDAPKWLHFLEQHLIVDPQ